MRYYTFLCKVWFRGSWSWHHTLFYGIASEIYQSIDEPIATSENFAIQIQKNDRVAAGIAKRAKVDGFNLVRYSTNGAKECLSAFIEKKKPYCAGGWHELSVNR